MAKLTFWCPSAIRRREMSSETALSVRPIRGISPAKSWIATRSAAAEALTRASISATSLTARRGLTTSELGCHLAPGRHFCNASTKVAQVRSDTASRLRAPTDSATRATGSSPSDQGRSAKAPGSCSTRGASSLGTNRVASLSTGTTSMVRRSRGGPRSRSATAGPLRARGGEHRLPVSSIRLLTRAKRAARPPAHVRSPARALCGRSPDGPDAAPAACRA